MKLYQLNETMQKWWNFANRMKKMQKSRNFSTSVKYTRIMKFWQFHKIKQKLCNLASFWKYAKIMKFCQCHETMQKLWNFANFMKLCKNLEILPTSWKYAKSRNCVSLTLEGQLLGALGTPSAPHGPPRRPTDPVSAPRTPLAPLGTPQIPSAPHKPPRRPKVPLVAPRTPSAQMNPFWGNFQKAMQKPPNVGSLSW